jgi:hypothetical protein
MGIFDKKKENIEIAHSETCMCGKCTGLESMRAELSAMRKEVANDRRYHEYAKAHKVIEEKNNKAMDYLKSLIRSRKGSADVEETQ